MSVIFDDLGIDYSQMMTDPASFWEQVLEAAESLKKILKADNSVDNYIKNKIETEAFDFKAEGFDKVLDELYSDADMSIPVGALHEFANKLRKLAKDIDFLARDKAMVEIASDQSIDKSLAFDMYKDLREKANQWVDAVNLLGIYNEADKLPSMPGNYGGTISLTNYVFIFTDDADKDKIPYREFTSVTRRLEREGKVLPEMKNKMDLVDYLRAHPELNVQVSEQRK